MQPNALNKATHQEREGRWNPAEAFSIWVPGLSALVEAHLSGLSPDFSYGHSVGSRVSRGSGESESPTSDTTREIIVTIQRLSQVQASGSVIKALPGLAPVSTGSNLADFSPYLSTSLLGPLRLKVTFTQICSFR